MGQSTYLCESWQGLIQYLVTMISKGYYWYQAIVPEIAISNEKWFHVDDRLMKKFDIIGKTKHNRYYNKKRGMANYLYIRFGALAYILKTSGKELEGCNAEIFRDIREIPLEVRISGEIILKINKGNKPGSFTVYLSKESYKSIKAELFEMLEHRQTRQLVFRFGILNNIPSYSGINEQKRILKKDILQYAKKNNVTIPKTLLWVGMRRKIYKVFS